FGCKSMDDDADGESQCSIDVSHRLRIASRKVIVHRDDMDRDSGECRGACRQRGGQSLALARIHLCNQPSQQHRSAKDLYIQMTLTQRPMSLLTYQCKRRGYDRIRITFPY